MLSMPMSLKAYGGKFSCLFTFLAILTLALPSTGMAQGTANPNAQNVSNALEALEIEPPEPDVLNKQIPKPSNNPVQAEPILKALRAAGAKAQYHIGVTMEDVIQRGNQVVIAHVAGPAGLWSTFQAEDGTLFHLERVGKRTKVDPKVSAPYWNEEVIFVDPKDSPMKNHDANLQVLGATPVDIGRAWIGTELSGEVSLQNVGSATLHLEFKDAQALWPFAVSQSNLVIPPDGTHTIAVSLEANLEPGPVEMELPSRSNDPADIYPGIAVKAEIADPVVISPTPIKYEKNVPYMGFFPEKIERDETYEKTLTLKAHPDAEFGLFSATPSSDAIIVEPTQTQTIKDNEVTLNITIDARKMKSGLFVGQVDIETDLPGREELVYHVVGYVDHE